MFGAKFGALQRPPAPSTQRLPLSVPEAAQVLGISRALAYELVARGEIGVVNIDLDALQIADPLLIPVLFARGESVDLVDARGNDSRAFVTPGVIIRHPNHCRAIPSLSWSQSRPSSCRS